VTGADAPVDWVFVELRDAGTGATVLATANGLVQRDGDVVAPAGGPLVFNAPPGEYRIAVRHRNHLGVMTASPVALTRVPVPVDLGDPLTAVFGTDARRQRDGKALLWTGNTRFDAQVSYTGTNNDRDPILTRIGGAVPTVVASGYFPEDVNLDGKVKYAGSLNDRDRVLLTIGGAVPTAVRSQQLP
jgi:hypothetical protein